MTSMDVPLVPVADDSGRVIQRTSRSSLTIDGSDDPSSFRRTPFRFVVLPCAAVTMFGSYYFFDQCSASEDPVREKLNITNTQFGFLQSVYSWPNTVLPLFGGVLIDRIGIRKSMLMFFSLVFAGQFVYSLGLGAGSFGITIAGRGIFGLGGESMNVAILALIAMWFRGKVGGTCWSSPVWHRGDGIFVMEIFYQHVRKAGPCISTIEQVDHLHEQHDS